MGTLGLFLVRLSMSYVYTCWDELNRPIAVLGKDLDVGKIVMNRMSESSPTGAMSIISNSVLLGILRFVNIYDVII